MYVCVCVCMCVCVCVCIERKIPQEIRLLVYYLSNSNTCIKKEFNIKIFPRGAELHYFQLDDCFWDISNFINIVF